MCPVRDLPCPVSANNWLIQQLIRVLITWERSPIPVTIQSQPPSRSNRILSKSEIVNITVQGRLRNPLPAGHSHLTASSARSNANSVRVLTSVNQFGWIQKTWLFQHPVKVIVYWRISVMPRSLLQAILWQNSGPYNKWAAPFFSRFIFPCFWKVFCFPCFFFNGMDAASRFAALAHQGLPFYEFARKFCKLAAVTASGEERDSCSQWEHFISVSVQSLRGGSPDRRRTHYSYASSHTRSTTFATMSLENLLL